MKVYSYKNIKNITEEGILFEDGKKLLFEECIKEWSVKNGIKLGESRCVAERNLLESPPYFLFFSEDRVKVIFDNKGFLQKKKNDEAFKNLQVSLNRFGVSSFDMT